MANRELLAAIDLEISRLKQARDLLLGGDAPASRGSKAAKPAEKKQAGRPSGTKRVLSADARKRIADAQKKRWAAHKGGK